MRNSRVKFICRAGMIMGMFMLIQASAVPADLSAFRKLQQNKKISAAKSGLQKVNSTKINSRKRNLSRKEISKKPLDSVKKRFTKLNVGKKQETVARVSRGSGDHMGNSESTPLPDDKGNRPEGQKYVWGDIKDMKVVSDDKIIQGPYSTVRKVKDSKVWKDKMTLQQQEFSMDPFEDPEIRKWQLDSESTYEMDLTTGQIISPEDIKTTVEDESYVKETRGMLQFIRDHRTVEPENEELQTMQDYLVNVITESGGDKYYLTGSEGLEDAEIDVSEAGINYGVFDDYLCVSDYKNYASYRVDFLTGRITSNVLGLEPNTTVDVDELGYGEALDKMIDKMQKAVNHAASPEDKAQLEKGLNHLNEMKNNMPELYFKLEHRFEKREL